MNSPAALRGSGPPGGRSGSERVGARIRPGRTIGAASLPECLKERLGCMGSSWPAPEADHEEDPVDPGDHHKLEKEHIQVRHTKLLATKLERSRTSGNIQCQGSQTPCQS